MIDVAAKPEPGLAVAGSPAEGTKLGKRYTLGGNAALELLVTKPGKYGLSVDGEPLVLKEAKPLPASDRQQLASRSASVVHEAAVDQELHAGHEPGLVG